MRFKKTLLTVGVVAASALTCLQAQADTGKLLLTGGVSTIDGAAGGGLVPWAVIGSNATDGEIGATAFVSRAVTQYDSLNVGGVAVGINNKYEVSFARQDLNTGVTAAPLGANGLHLKQNIFGVKARVAGDAVLDSDNLMPQIAVGAQFKSLDSSDLDPTLSALGATRSGVDYYVSATKLFLAQGILLNGTLRATKANQDGLLGFGATLGGAKNSYSFLPEFSAAYLLSSKVAVGAEYRFMPNNLEVAGQAAKLGQNGLSADAWKDVFVAWAPNKYYSLTAAYVNLGRVVGATTNGTNQTGLYLSAQFAY